MEPWEAALDQFLQEWREKDCVLGALVCGSYVTGNPSAHSDLDVHIILSEDCDWRERGNRIIDGFLIEYFANPPGQIGHYFREDHSDNCRDATTQFATGRVIFDKIGIIEKLKKEAGEWLAKPLPRLSETVWGLTKYALWDNLDNLQDTCEQQSPDYLFVYHHTLRRIYEAYARYLGQPVVAFSKQFKCLHQPEEVKRKYLMEPFPDNEFLEIMLDAITETSAARMTELAGKLTWHVLNQMGGIEVDGWKFRSPAKK